MVREQSGKAEKREPGQGNAATLREVLAAQDLQPFGGWGDFILKCEHVAQAQVSASNQHGNQHPSPA